MDHGGDTSRLVRQTTLSRICSDRALMMFNHLARPGLPGVAAHRGHHAVVHAGFDCGIGAGHGSHRCVIRRGCRGVPVRFATRSASCKGKAQDRRAKGKILPFPTPLILPQSILHMGAVSDCRTARGLRKGRDSPRLVEPRYLEGVRRAVGNFHPGGTPGHAGNSNSLEPGRPLVEQSADSC